MSLHPARSRALFILLLIGIPVAFLIYYRVTAPVPDPSHIASNDMGSAAGELSNGVLNVRLVAQDGEWYPEGADGPPVQVAAFAEEGKPMQNPGPLLRVPVGTEVQASVRNALEVPLTIYGLGAQRGLDADSTVLEPGATGEFRFTANEPGIFPYAGRTEPVPTLLLRTGHDSQLNGVIAVDAPDVARPSDRIFLISWFFSLDSTTTSGLGEQGYMVINGREWPHTEKFDVSVGDSMHWRWVNTTIAPHPMHLHGFYFRLTGRGDGASFGALPHEEQRLSVTEILPPGGTMSLVWAPDRPGNWIFHCHFAGHMATMGALNQDRRHPTTIAAAAAQRAHLVSGGEPTVTHTHPAVDHSQHGMAGLVLGIRVRPRGRAVDAPAGEERAMRLLMRSRPEVYGENAGYGYVLGGSPEEPERDAFSTPGPTLVMRKNERVAITLVNQTHEPAAVHWHGIELESWPDGVVGWSGSGKNVLPMIPSGDSLTVRFTPPRAGTFMYHSHMNEFQQISSGMYGAIVVLEPEEEFDHEHDRLLVFSDGGPTINVISGPFPPILLNGKLQPEPMELRAGERYRFRVIGIPAEAIVRLELLDGTRPVQWTMIAKDGATLPPAQAKTLPAHLEFAAGETYDFAFIPERKGSLTLRFGPGEVFPGAPPVVSVAVNVR